MDNHKQIVSFMIAILVLGGGSLGIIFAEINQTEDAVLEHVQEPCHGVACNDVENIKEDVSEIKTELKEFRAEVRAWYQDQG